MLLLMLDGLKTICIETEHSSSIGGGIRFLDDDLIYTTNQQDATDKIRMSNCKRFGKRIIKLSSLEISKILKEDNNIQIVNNNGVSTIAGMYEYPENHDILSKTGIIKLFLFFGRLLIFDITLL